MTASRAGGKQENKKKKQPAIGLNNKKIQPLNRGCSFTSNFLTPNFIGGH